MSHLHAVKPDEVYNLGAQSHVKVSFEMPEFTADTAAMGALRLLEAIRTAHWPIRFYQASSSEMYGRVLETPQSETTPFNPRSPYAIAKVFAHWMTVDYREAYGMHASNGILFNHDLLLLRPALGRFGSAEEEQVGDDVPHQREAGVPAADHLPGLHPQQLREDLPEFGQPVEPAVVAHVRPGPVPGSSWELEQAGRRGQLGAGRLAARQVERGGPGP